MVSAWQRPEGESVEIEVEARPAGRSRSPRPVVQATSPPRESARRGAQVLRVLAYFIAASSVLGYILLSFWESTGEFADEDVRQRIGNLLVFMWGPLAVAGLVYAASLLVTLYAARIELDRRLHPDQREEP
jgi:hypothetical protein